MINEKSFVTIYGFSTFQIYPGRRILLNNGQPVHIPAKSFDLLVILIENRGRVIERAELISSLWPDSFVEDMTLTVHVSALRKTLGENPNEHKYIVTVPGRGYSFVADVEVTIIGQESGDELSEREKDDRSVGSLSEEPKKNTGRPNPAEVEETTTAEARQSIVKSRTLHFPYGNLNLSRRGKLILLGFVFIVVFTAIPRYSTILRKNKDIGSVAVLPFKVVGEQDDDYLQLGMADALIIRLSNVKGLKILPTTSIARFVEQDYDPFSVGQMLRVDSVITGTVQQAGEQVRLTVQLISVEDARVVWAGKFDEKRSSIFAIQDSISAQASSELSLKLAPSNDAGSVKVGTNDLQAQHAYLKGLFFWSKRTEADLIKSIEYFQKAIDHDPDYARAYGSLADALALLATNFHTNGQQRAEAIRKARAAAMKSIELDEATAEAHTALALFIRDISEAKREQERALELDPNSATAHHRYGLILLQQGEEWERGLLEMRKAVELDPLSPVAAAAFGQALFFSGDYDRSAEQCRTALELRPGYFVPQIILAASLGQQGRYQEAIAELGKVKNPGNDPGYLSTLGYIQARSGQRAEAEKIIRRLESIESNNKLVTWAIARVYAGLGDRDQAFEWLEKGARNGVPFQFRFRNDPRIKVLQDDHRYSAFLESLKLQMAKQQSVYARESDS